jgi:putative PIN family toxin of toxin-antitoxin system
MIITADAGILARATARSNGPARRLLEILAANPAHQLAISPYILNEVGKTLAYSKLQAILDIAADEIHEHLAYLRRIARVVEPELGGPVVLNDPKDDPVVYTAIAAGAEVLCVRDRDFYVPHVIAFCRRHGVEIMDEIRLLSVLQS